MVLKVRKLVWNATSVGLALLASTAAGRVQAAAGQQPTEASSDEVVQASGTNIAIVDSLIEDAIEDGAISAEERRLILGQARRRLNGAEVAEVEARLETLPLAPTSAVAPTTAAILGKTLISSPTDDPQGLAGDNGKACCDQPGCGGLFDNMYYFANMEAWQGPVDDDANPNNFGGRFGVNLGFPLLECYGIGAQVGASYGFYNLHGRGNLGAASEFSAVEDHLMTTIGIFQRSELCDPCPRRWNWGIAYDRLYADNIGEDSDEIYIGQWRLQFGYALSLSDEVGFWTTQGNEGELLKGRGTEAHSLHQYNMFWHHKWCDAADTRAWFGLAEDPGELVFGADAKYPINNCLSLIGGAQYIWPSAGPGENARGTDQGFAQEAWNLSVGVAYYPGGNAKTKTVAGRRWMPYFDVADNGSFVLEAPGD